MDFFVLFCLANFVSTVQWEYLPPDARIEVA